MTPGKDLQNIGGVLVTSVCWLVCFCVVYKNGPEGVKRELGFAFFRGWEMGFCTLGLGFMKQKQWDFNLRNTGWDCGI